MTCQGFSPKMPCSGRELPPPSRAIATRARRRAQRPGCHGPSHPKIVPHGKGLHRPWKAADNPTDPNPAVWRRHDTVPATIPFLPRSASWSETSRTYGVARRPRRRRKVPRRGPTDVQCVASDNSPSDDQGARMRAGGRRRGAGPSPTTSRRPRWGPDVLGLLWTTLAAFAVLAPALRPGVSLGPFALLAHAGLTSHAGIPVHNPSQSDQILFFSPMTDLAWQQVHAGHLPLWDPYNVLGTPLAFNWESAVFSLPMLIGYLFHASFAYTVVVLVKLVIAGAGVYVCCRSFGLKPMSSAFGGTIFELSGTIVHYSGWSIVGVECWYGWILGLAVLLVKGRHRARDTVLLAIVIAFAIYGGYPAGLLLIAIALFVFFLIFFVFRPPGGQASPHLAREPRGGRVCAARHWAHRSFSPAFRPSVVRPASSPPAAARCTPCPTSPTCWRQGSRGRTSRRAPTSECSPSFSPSSPSA